MNPDKFNRGWHVPYGHQITIIVRAPDGREYAQRVDEQALVSSGAPGAMLLRTVQDGIRHLHPRVERRTGPGDRRIGAYDRRQLRLHRQDGSQSHRRRCATVERRRNRPGS